MNTRRRQALALALGAACTAAAWTCNAQGSERTRRIGVIWDASHKNVLDLLKQRLRELGWTPGQNVVYVERITQTTDPNLERLAGELVEARVDVIYLDDFAAGPAFRKTRSIPIVCPNLVDPVEEGFTRSIARPDANVTGISWQSLDSTVKRLQLARELVPGLKRIAVLFDAMDEAARLDSRRTVSSAEGVSMAASLVELRGAESAASAMERVNRAQPQLLIVSANPRTFQIRADIIREATAARIPIVSEIPPFALDGGILSYGADVRQAYLRGAYFVDRILRGVKVADLPFEQPNTFVLVVNVKAARALGITVPASILQAADKVIE